MASWKFGMTDAQKNEREVGWGSVLWRRKGRVLFKVGDAEELNQANNIDSHCIVNSQLQINVNLTDFSLRYERCLKFCLDLRFCLTACLWGLIALSSSTSSTENVLNEIIIYVSIICRVCWVCKILKKYLKHENGCMGWNFRVLNVDLLKSEHFIF